MLRIFLLSLLFIFLVRFILRFVIPLFRITSAVRGQMKNMQGAGQRPMAPPPQSRPQQKSRKGDYIDYEEIK
jgi:hypothetical protein